MTTLNKTSGVLTSPYYPRRYPSNVNCSWKIIASKGESIVLSIEDIDIVDCGSSCTCDYLKIQNGSSSDGISSRRRCGNYKDREIIYRSAKDVLRVTFVSDSRELKIETFSGRRQLQPDVTSLFVGYCACSCSPPCRRGPVGDVKLLCLALWRKREYLTVISIRFVAFSNQHFADYRS